MDGHVVGVPQERHRARHAAKSEDEVGMLLNRFYSNASRRGLTHMVTVAQTIRKRRAAILAAVRLGVKVPATKAFANVV